MGVIREDSQTIRRRIFCLLGPPDGKRIAFVSDRGRSFRYLRDRTLRVGIFKTSLTYVSARTSDPAWFHPNLAIAPAVVAPIGKKPTMWAMVQTG